MRTPEQAIAWARARVGHTGWDNLCLSFVRQAFDVYYTPDYLWPVEDRNAGTAWDRAEFKHRTSNPMDIPAGVPVFFEMATAADHVVLSTGHGRCIGNDFVVDGRIDTNSIAEIAAKWGPLLGWTEDLVGNRIWTPPAPKPVRPPRVQRELDRLRDIKQDWREAERRGDARKLGKVIDFFRSKFPAR